MQPEPVAAASLEAFSAFAVCLIHAQGIIFVVGKKCTCIFSATVFKLLYMFPLL